MSENLTRAQVIRKYGIPRGAKYASEDLRYPVKDISDQNGDTFHCTVIFQDGYVEFKELTLP